MRESCGLSQGGRSRSGLKLCKALKLFYYRIYPCIMRTFFTTFEAEKLRCALYTEPFVSEALLICINKRNNSRWLFPGLLL